MTVIHVWLEGKSLYPMCSISGEKPHQSMRNEKPYRKMIRVIAAYLACHINVCFTKKVLDEIQIGGIGRWAPH